MPVPAPYNNPDIADIPWIKQIYDLGGAVYDATPALRWNGATGNDNTPYLQDLEEEVAVRGGGLILLPRGTGRLRSGYVTRHSDIHVWGRPGAGTHVRFDPTDPDTMMKAELEGGGIIARVSFGGFMFSSPANNGGKPLVAFEIVDGTRCAIRHVTGNEQSWDHPGSIVIKLRGREFTTIEEVTGSAERILVLDANPGTASIGCDHLTFRGNNHFIGRGAAQNPDLTARPIITKLGGCPVTSLKNCGNLSLNRGSKGFEWLSTGDTDDSFMVDLTGFRREQPNDPGAGNELYAFDMADYGRNLWGLTLGQCSLSGAVVDGRSHGIRLQGVIGARLGPIFYPGPFNALELGSGCADIHWEDFECTDNAALVNSGDLEPKKRVYRQISSSFPVEGHYVRKPAIPGGYTLGEKRIPNLTEEVREGLHYVSLADAAEMRLPVEVVGQPKALRLEVLLVGADNAERAHGVWTKNGGATPAWELSWGTANCKVTADANSVYTDVSSNPARTSFVNNLGQTATGFYRFEFVT